MYVRMCVYVCMYVCVCMYVFMYVCMYVCVCKPHRSQAGNTAAGQNRETPSHVAHSAEDCASDLADLFHVRGPQEPKHN